MRNIFLFFILTLCCVFIGCFGGSPGAKAPKHLTAGERQTEQGMEWYGRGCYGRALEHFLRAYELYLAADQATEANRTLNNMANAYRKTGDYKTAEAMYAEAAVGFLDSGDNNGQALAMANHAAAMLDQGRQKEAESLLDQAQALLTPTDKAGLAAVSMTRAVMAAQNQNQDSALVLYETALANVAPDDDAGRAAIFYGQAKAMLAKKRPEEASARFLAARDLDIKLGNTQAMADDLMGLAMASRNTEQALALYKRAALAYAIAEKPDQANEALSRVHELSGKPAAIPDLFVELLNSGKAYEYPCKR